MKPSLLLILLVFLGASCVQALPTATQTPASTPAPSATPSPTAGVSQTPTHLPTATVFLPPTATSLPTPGAAMPGQHAYQIQVNGVGVRFLMYLPKSYGTAPSKKWPVILFLHGSGQGDGPVENVAATGLPQRLKVEEDFPFIVISPQLPDPQNATPVSGIDDFMVQYGWGRWIEPLEGLLGWLETHLPVDPRREYLTGLSMGGFGVWEYARSYPQRFAAIAPIAGGLEFSQTSAPEDICRLKDLPIWAFHGEKDTTVSPTFTTVLIEALRACGGSPKLTLYPDEGHSGSWNQAYSGQDLFDWMLTYPK